MQFYDFKEIEERVILIGVQTEQDEDVAASLDELEELAATAGAVTVGKVIQNREAVHPGTYIGKGKIEEVAALLAAYDANGVICDDELSPAQMNNLERELDCKVMDRTLLILDIFAGRATTSEGKIQVELAQLRYRSARLVGLRESLSRLGGGIGTRGPGEKKLETDRRLIRTRISALKAELAQVEKHRELIRGKRSRGNLKTAAIVGYTNAGKSTLLNCLANILEPYSGKILVNGASIHDMSLKKAAQLIGYVPQNHAPVYDYSVRDFIVMGRAPHLGMLEKPSENDYAIVDEVIRELGIEKLADKAYTQISGGEQQQALIGRAIAQQPEIIMFDEPTNHLDYGNQLRMVHKIKNLSKKDYTVIMTTHMPDHAMMIGGKTAILGRDGTLKVGKTEEIITEKKLEELYQVKTRIVYIPEVGRKVCVVAEQ